MTENLAVRLTKIKLNDFKNVKNGEIILAGTEKKNAGILGIYGQNGSGKTALINALSVLKTVLSGDGIASGCADYIYITADSALLEFDFEISDGEGLYTVYYTFRLGKKSVEKEGARIFDEKLSLSYVYDDIKMKKTLYISTAGEEPFTPEAKYNVIAGRSKSTFTDLVVERRLAEAMSRSFIFSPAFISLVKKNCRDEKIVFILSTLSEYGINCLHVIGKENDGLISLNALPVSFTSVGVPLGGTAVIPLSETEKLKKSIQGMNIVLEQIIPGLNILVKDFGAEITKDRKEGRRVQLLSLKGNKEIPLCYESDGIKKIISVLQLLIAVYNESCVTVAIDELDSGIFEYLLGELIKIIADNGKGQLIFTSHNLRPLEILDKASIAFTTTNPEERYIRFKNVKTDNLRDFYFRDILLGEQEKPVYDRTDNYKIALAFKKAGETSGS